MLPDRETLLNRLRLLERLEAEAAVIITAREDVAAMADALCEALTEVQDDREGYLAADAIG